MEAATQRSLAMSATNPRGEHHRRSEPSTGTEPLVVSSGGRSTRLPQTGDAAKTAKTKNPCLDAPLAPWHDAAAMPLSVQDVVAVPLPASRPTSLPVLVLTPEKRWFDLNLGDLWQYRELLFFLTWRDVKVRYKQTVLGALWALLQPLLTMVVFSFVFGKLAKLPSGGVPYPVFTFTALLPWQLFAFSLTNASNSLVGNQNLISKVYFPRLIVPIAAVLPGLVDFVISFIFLLAMLLFYGIPFSARMLTLPAFLLLAMSSAMAIGLWLSALNVQYRDVRYVVPFLATFWQYATPVGYSSTIVPERWRLLYSLNPMTGVVDGFRWALLGVEGSSSSIGISSVIVLVMLVGGLVYFKRMEAGFADVI
jgi:lipopolysaccharide transport system permease protein